MASTDDAPDRLFRPLARRQLIVDLVVAGALFALCVVGAATIGAVEVVVAVILCGALALRRLSPALALGTAWLGAILQMSTLQQIAPSDVAILGVLYGTARYGGRITRWAGLASAVAGSIIGTLYLGFVDPVFSAGTPDALPVNRVVAVFAFYGIGMLAVLGLSWTLGLLARTRALTRAARLDARIARERADYELAVEQERTRIARDMHDVVAHSLAVVIAQADGARYAASARPDAQAEALTTIAATARTALGDVRLLLSELRQDAVEGPQPTLDDLPRLFDRMRSTGLAITVTTEGHAPVFGAGAQIAAYRILQEALTNALRHGRPFSPVAVDLAYSPEALRLRVDNVVEDADGTTAGHGLPGMRERAVLAGGSLDAGPTGSGHWVVDARIPVGEATER